MVLRCSNCKWYDTRKPDGTEGDDGRGLCRYYGPTVGHVSTVEENETGGIVNKVQILTHWPSVKGDHDFCSHYDPRKAATKPKRSGNR